METSKLNMALLLIEICFTASDDICIQNFIFEILAILDSLSQSSKEKLGMIFWNKFGRQIWLTSFPL